MNEKNINMLDSEAERQRYFFNMLPTYLISKMGFAGIKKYLQRFTKGLSKVQIKRDFQLVNILNELATTEVNDRIRFEDINYEVGELSNHPYQALLGILGIDARSKLYEHAKIIDSCLSQKMSANQIEKFQDYLIQNFKFTDASLRADSAAEEFYLSLILSLIAHLDAYFHYHECSQTIAPISLGWLFMSKLDAKKWSYDEDLNKLELINKEGRFYTCTSKFFLQWSQTFLYFQQYKHMPKGLYGITNEIDWPDNDPDGKLESFLRRKSEGKWITLEELYWLLGEFDNPSGQPLNDEAYEALNSFQNSMIQYIKTEDVEKFGKLPENFIGIVWVVYAFFQNIYEQCKKDSNNQSCIIYDDYYDMWQSITDYYENMINQDVKDKRVEWPEYLKKSATRQYRMADLKF
jgi:hypothetical protein